MQAQSGIVKRSRRLEGNAYDILSIYAFGCLPEVGASVLDFWGFCNII